MPPRRGESIERTDEHDEFIKVVREYHEKRGTHFDAEPKVGVRHIDLRNLYRRVVEEGGYDLCSDTKAKPLMWRKLAEEFVGKNQYTAAQAFQIKNVYYKNLCAYEISTHWKKEPPPKEILEEVTAKGGNVMTRTLENFEPPSKREERYLHNADNDGSDSSPEQKSTKDDKPDDDPSNSTGRSTRGLRQQPPQRVLFQPDLSSTRQSRTAPQGSHGSPAPPGNPNGVLDAPFVNHVASSTLASYEPPQSYPLSLRPVITPANNPEFYRNERKRRLEANAGPLSKKYRNIMLPGTGFIGPNIYVRAQQALQSGLAEEERYALHHLVKISHERGDKYRFDQFPGLGEALVKKTLQISGLFYNVDWEISYDDDPSGVDEETLNGLRGTSDIIAKLRSRTPLVTNDTMLDAHFLSQINLITEAALIIRNMCLLDENAHYMARLPLMRDYLSVVLNLPQHNCIAELQHYALESAEQVLKYCDIGSHDSLYHSLLFQLDRKDRGAITLALRIISRIAMHFDHPKRLDDIPDHILQNVQDWLMVDDEELRSACLDFLIQYTSFADNVDNLLQTLDVELLAQRLSRLLLFAAKEQRIHNAPSKPQTDDFAASVPRLSQSVVESLVKIDEPERSSEWLRMCFRADPSSEMTQISLWQAYQATFKAFQGSHPHLIAGDFIKNVSNTFPGAAAQVAGSNKYVIRGIRARMIPIETGLLNGTRSSADKTKELHKCYWNMTVPVETHRDPLSGAIVGSRETKEIECNEWFRTSDDMLKHILSSHLQIPAKQVASPKFHADAMDVDSIAPTNAIEAAAGEDARTLGESFDFTTPDNTVHRCRWADCKRSTLDFTDDKAPKTVFLARHIQTHLPDTDELRAKHNFTADKRKPLGSGDAMALVTLFDDRGDAAGIPLSAALVLRNIAKFMPRVREPETMNGNLANEGENSPLDLITGEAEREEAPMWAVFDDEVMERLFYAMANNKVINQYVGSVLKSVQAGGG